MMRSAVSARVGVLNCVLIRSVTACIALELRCIACMEQETLVLLSEECFACVNARLDYCVMIRRVISVICVSAS